MRQSKLFNLQWKWDQIIYEHFIFISFTIPEIDTFQIKVYT